MYKTLKENRSHGTTEYPYSQYHIFMMETSFQFPVHWHNELEIIYIRKGQLDISINGQSFSGDRNSIFIVNPKELHFMGSMDINVDYYTIIFPLEFVSFQSDDIIESALFSPLRNGRICFKNQLNITEEIRELIEKMIDANKFCKNLREFNTKIYLLQFFSKLFEMPDSITKNHRDNTDTQREMISYIREHYTEKITLKDFAAEFHMSEKYISRYFKEHFNITFSKYVNHMRLSHSKKLLDTTDYSVTDIALFSGFPNVSYFIRSFKAGYGVTPLKYRG